MPRSRSSLAYVIPSRSAPGGKRHFAPRHPRAFGRARRYDSAIAQPVPAISDDLRQAMMTFLGGLVFVAVFIG